MAIYHFSVNVIKRSKGKSSVASAAYRSGTKIKDERYNTTHNYENKKVDESFIMLPNNAPVRFIDRKILWNEVERVETHSLAQVSREINFALPIELSHEEQKRMVREYVQENFVDKGMISDVAIHRDNPANPHAHVMLTMRGVNEEGFEKTKTSTRHWNNKDNVEIWREKFADITNKYLMENGIEKKVDHRSLKEQGINRIPQIHEGMVGRQMEKKGIKSDRVSQNQEIKQANEEIKLLEQQQYELERDLLIGEFHQLGEVGQHLTIDRQSLERKLQAIKQDRKNLIDRKKDLPKLREEALLNIRKLKPKNKIHAFFMGKKRKNQLNDSIEHYNSLKQEDKDFPMKLENYDSQITEYETEINKKKVSMSKNSEQRQVKGRELSNKRQEKIANEKKQNKKKQKNTERQM
ncbi:TPA: MobA/MobL family protein [Bacillus cereus]|nr:MobA/MobL family protein [Bacillus cereus]